ncbi:MAG: aminopeptidase P family protein [Nocardiopsaceae bacterium]|nr:aminopeptidase P family protein [Nocardiopsaceae bacterium]
MTVGIWSTKDAAFEGEHGYPERIAVLRRHMRRLGLAAVAVASPENVYYLTGLDHLGYFAFTLLIVAETGQPTLVTRAMESPTVRAQVPWCRHVAFGDGEAPAAAAVAALSGAMSASTATLGSTMAMDEESMFFPPAIAEAIRQGLPGVAWRSGSAFLAMQRAVKSPAEVACMRRAAGISDQAMAAGIAAARPGAGERSVAAEVYRGMIEAGGEPPGFPPLIRPTAILDREHVSWSSETLRPGTGLFFELSGSVRRYHAPQSRIVYLGEAPRKAAEAAESALAGLVAAREALRPGAFTGEVYAAWQRVAAGGAATAAPVRHHCGYLVGIGFPPSWVGGGSVMGIRAGGEVEIVPGMTFHLMSWVTRPVGHVISDTVLVTETGAEFLTTTSRQLTVVG